MKKPIKLKRFDAGGQYADQQQLDAQQANVRNTLGKVPIIGLFKGIGEGVSSAISSKDQYGVNQGSNTQVALASTFNPADAVTSITKDFQSGNVNAKTFAKMIPGVGGVLANNERKKMRDQLIKEQTMLRNQGALNSQIQQDNDVAMNQSFACGGVVKYPKGGSTTATNLYESDPYYPEFQEVLGKSLPTIQDKARLYYYTQKLNQHLREKNPEVYDKLVGEYGFNPDKPLTTKTRTEGADKYAKENPNFYLNPDEQKSYLSDDEYKDYITLKGKYGKDYNLIGENEDASKPDTWMVGARHATAFNPVNYTMEKQPAQNSFDPAKRTFKYNIKYDPSNTENPYSSTIDYKKYAHGGYTVDDRGFANSELEDKEIYRTPQGGMYKLNGPTHAEGGIAMNLPQGTEILGKDKIPGTNTSFKEYGDNLMKDYNKYTKILTGKHTPIAKKTASMMLDKVNKEFDNLMNIQETQKAMGQGDYNEEGEEYAHGGWIQKAINPAHKGYCTPMTKSTCTPHRKALAMRFKHGDLHKHANGGGINDMTPEQVRAFQNQYGLTTDEIVGPKTTTAWNKYGNEYSQNMAYSPTSIGLGSGRVVSDLPSTYTKSVDNTPLPAQQSSGGGSGFDWKNMATTAAEVAPIAYNLGQGLFGKTEKLNAQDYYNPYENATMNTLRSRRYDVSPELDTNRLQESIYLNNLRQGAASQAQYLGGLSAASINRSRADAEAYSRKQNADNQYLGDEANMLANFGAQRAATKLNIQDVNDKNAAAKKEYLTSGLTQMQQYAQNLRMTQGLKNRDKQLMDIYKKMYRGYSFSE